MTTIIKIRCMYCQADMGEKDGEGVSHSICDNCLLHRFPDVYQKMYGDQALLTCPHCGHIGRDVVVKKVYVGGKGYVRQIQCWNETECWRRWDLQHAEEMR